MRRVIASPVARFALRTFLWLPPCFAAWYYGGKYLTPIVGGAALAIVDLVRSGLVTALERRDLALVFVTSIEVHPQAGRAGVLLVEVNPLLYMAGLPLFLALGLASKARWWKIVAGAVLLLPFQAWGIAFDFLAQVGVKAGWEIASRAGLSGWRAEFIALSYQLGSLIFPALAPVVLWIALDRAAFADLARHRPRESIAAVK